jgi:cytoskeletal protein CcmA (bactofilin family)
MFNNKPTSRPDQSPASGSGQPISPQPSTPAPAAEPKRPSKIASLLAAGMTMEGTITSDGEFTVEGIVRGDIKVARLTIGEVGQIEGSITAEAVECRGRVIGAISAKQVRLYASAHVDGDITHEQLAMETGAFFQGRSLKFQRQPQTAPKGPPAPAPEAVGSPGTLSLPSPERAS